MKMRVVITGANGQLGTALVENAPENVEIIPHKREDFDLRDIDTLERFLRETAPDIVINTAAFHDTEACETEFEEALFVNAIIPTIMARILEEIGGIVVFISTDYVFDGEKRGELYLEDDLPNPLNRYGISKLAGEVGVSKLSSKFYIFRLSSLFGKTRKRTGNFVLKIIEKAKKGEPLRVVNDIFMTPTYAPDAARRIWEVLLGDFSPGVYHVSNSGVTSWFDFAKEILRIKGIDKDVMPVSHTEIKTKVKRPLWSPLGSKYLSPLRHWGEALKEYLEVESWT